MYFPQKPKVSYLLSVYNGAKTLSLTLDSLLRQKAVNLEIIAVNDGSTDNSAEILYSYASRDKRIKIFNLPHMGLSFSRNFAFSKSTAGFIASASQDDIYFPEKTVMQINFLRRKNLDFCFTEVELIDSQGKIFSHLEKKIDNARLLPPPFDIIQVLIFMDVCSPTFLCRRKCYQKLLWHPALMIFADKYLFLKMFLHFKGGKLPKISLLRRYPDDTKIRQVKRRFPVEFLYLEHRSAMLTALLHKFVPSIFIPPFNNFFKIVKCLLNIEINRFDLSAYHQLMEIYENKNFRYPAKRLQSIVKIMENGIITFDK